VRLRGKTKDREGIRGGGEKTNLEEGLGTVDREKFGANAWPEGEGTRRPLGGESGLKRGVFECSNRKKGHMLKKEDDQRMAKNVLCDCKED